MFLLSKVNVCKKNNNVDENEREHHVLLTLTSAALQTNIYCASQGQSGEPLDLTAQPLDLPARLSKPTGAVIVPTGEAIETYRRGHCTYWRGHRDLPARPSCEIGILTWFAYVLLG